MLINALGTRERMMIALGVKDYGEITERIIGTHRCEITSRPDREDQDDSATGRSGERCFRRSSKTDRAKNECLKEGEFSLFDFPIIKCWPEDGGRFITLPLVFTKNPETGKRNCGMYRMQVYDEKTTGMHWQTHKHGAQHFRNLKRGGGGRLDVGVAIGADPVTVFSAIMPLPEIWTR